MCKEDKGKGLGYLLFWKNKLGFNGQAFVQAPSYVCAFW